MDIQSPSHTREKQIQTVRKSVRTIRAPIRYQEREGRNLKSNSEEVIKVGDMVRIAENNVGFTRFEDINNLIVTANDSTIELPEHILTKYCGLCCSQNSSLHKNLKVNSQLVAGIIMEIVSIADVIKASGLSTSPEVFQAMETKLAAFETLGMDVKFLQVRVKNLVSIAFQSKEDRNAYKGVVAAREKVKEKIKIIKEKLCELEEISKRLDTNVEILKAEAEQAEQEFKETLDLPW